MIIFFLISVSAEIMMPANSTNKIEHTRHFHRRRRTAGLGSSVRIFIGTFYFFAGYIPYEEHCGSRGLITISAALLLQNVVSVNYIQYETSLAPLNGPQTI